MAVLDRFHFRAYTLALALFTLGGCSTPSRPAPEVYRTVAVPTPVSCVPKTLAPAPIDLKTPAQLAAIPDGPSRYVAMAEDWFQRVRRMNDTEPVVKACQEAAPAP